ncbi:hypothetical protein FACS1894123_04290 [Bacteroidia bacterium]|nr:hypothetical protein FACS1894123_04290 [Bacteroidia bacterium]
MENEFDYYLTELIKNRKMETDEQIESFEQALDSIFSRRDFNDFDNLIKGFDDGTENKEVMFSLVHAVEYFAENFEKYLTSLLRKKKNWNKKQGFYDREITQ